MNTRALSTQLGPPVVVFVLAFLVSSFLAPAGAGSKDEQEITLKTNIATATIYPDRAQVTRSGKTEVKPGLYKLICDDLPQGFDESSLQVEGRGTAQVRIMGVDIVKMRGLVAESPRYKELKEKLEKLTGKRDTLQIELNAMNSSVTYLDNFAKYPFEKADAKLTTEIFRVQDWKNVLDFISTERIKTNEKIDALNKRGRKLTEEIDWINGQLNDMQMKDNWSKRAVVDCEASTPGDLAVSFTYNVPGATWAPEYMVRYDTAREKIELTYNARIQQFTGEDWQHTAVTLSTARPQLGAAPPEITPWYLQQRVVRVTTYDRVKEAGELKAGMARNAETETLAAAVAEPPQEFEAVPTGAELASTEFAAAFSIPKAVDLPSGADPRRVLILQEEVAGKLSRYAAPRLSPNVFTKGDVQNTLDVPLLGGTADVYVETAAPGGQSKTSNFVGKEMIKSVLNGQEFAVHLGIDQDFKVTHKLEKKEYLSKEGAVTRKIRYHYLMTIESSKKGPAAVTLQDRIPVSTLKEVKVTGVDIEPKPSEEREDGIITWSLNLAPKAKQEIRVLYTIEMPGDWPEYSINLE
jgi:uncharacterized protein (TIGR02231 family)